MYSKPRSGFQDPILPRLLFQELEQREQLQSTTTPKFVSEDFQETYDMVFKKRVQKLSSIMKRLKLK